MKSVLTIAVGKQVYVDMAINLAMSYLLWNKGNGIKFILVTDRADIVKKSIIYNDIIVLEIDSKMYDDGFAIKLYLDKFVQTDETLFIDCDCLVYSDVAIVFEKFKNQDFSLIGEICENGDFFGDIFSICKNFKINYLPRFVGAIYFIKKGIVSSSIFDFARYLKPQYDDIGLIRLRNKENEEPLIAISMAKNNQKPIIDDGKLKADRMSFSSIKSNVLYGKCELFNKKNEYPTWNKLISSKPIITHFNASFSEQYIYKADVKRLLIFYKFKSKIAANLVASSTVYYPGLIKESIKKYLRPISHKIIGVRKVVITKR